MEKNNYIDKKSLYGADRIRYEKSLFDTVEAKYAGKARRIIRAIQKLPANIDKSELIDAVTDYSKSTSKYIAWLGMERDEAAHIAAKSIVDRFELNYLRNEVARCHSVIDQTNSEIFTFTGLILKRNGHNG